jgi:hypothetical protein
MLAGLIAVRRGLLWTFIVVALPFTCGMSAMGSTIPDSNPKFAYPAKPQSREDDRHEEREI